VTSSYTNRIQPKAIQAGGSPPLATYNYDLNGNRTGKTLGNVTATSYQDGVRASSSMLARVENFSYNKL